MNEPKYPAWLSLLILGVTDALIWLALFLTLSPIGKAVVRFFQ